MNGADFLDTNILVYALEQGDLAKQTVAQQCVDAALRGHGVISTQVATEFTGILLHKLKRKSALVAEMVASLHPIRLVATDFLLIDRAVEAQARYGLHFYDCLIVAAAERAGCKRILSEDLSAGQTYFGVKVENPFV